MATIKDVAKRAGVAPSTISKYINGGHVLEENAEAIRAAIEELNYRVNPFARSLKIQKSRSIGILLPDISAPFFGNVLIAMDKVFRQHGYHSLISCYQSNHGLERDNLRFLISMGVDGLVYAPEDLSVDEFHELTGNSTIPTVQMDRALQGLSTDSVLVDNSEAVQTAITQLYNAGHSRIAIIAGPKSVYSARERHVGYLRALSELGILYDDQLVICEQNDFATGYRGFDTLMGLDDPPTAVFTTNHNITMGFLTAAREKGMDIPRDVGIFGFDCVEICSMMNPPIPVVHQPEQEIGELTAQYLIERIEGYNGPARITKLNCTIVTK